MPSLAVECLAVLGSAAPKVEQVRAAPAAASPDLSISLRLAASLPASDHRANRFLSFRSIRLSTLAEICQLSHLEHLSQPTAASSSSSSIEDCLPGSSHHSHSLPLPLTRRPAQATTSMKLIGRNASGNSCAKSLTRACNSPSHVSASSTCETGLRFLLGIG